jgi:hypothetical protein
MASLEKKHLVRDNSCQYLLRFNQKIIMLGVKIITRGKYVQIE